MKIEEKLCPWHGVSRGFMRLTALLALVLCTFSMSYAQGQGGENQQSDSSTDTDDSDTWRLSGSMNSWATSTGNGYDFTESSDEGVYTLTLDSLYGEFKLIKDSNWDTQYGASSSNTTISLNEEFTLYSSNNTNISVSGTLLNVKLTLTISDSGATLLITNVDYSTYTWSLCGESLNNWEEEDTTYDFTNNGDSTFTLTVDSIDMYGFKIVADHSWDLNFGGDNTTAVAYGTPYTLVKTGGNLWMESVGTNVTFTLDFTGDTPTLTATMADEEEETYIVDGWERIAFFEYVQLSNTDYQRNENGVSESVDGEFLVSGCTIAWTSLSNPTSSGNYETVDGKYYYKLSGGSDYYTITLADGDILEGDSLVLDICSNSSSAKETGFYVGSAKEDSITATVSDETSALAGGTLTASNITDGKVYLYRCNSNVRLHGIYLYRYTQPTVTLSADVDECQTGDTVTLTATVANADGDSIVWHLALGDNVTVLDTTIVSDTDNADGVYTLYYTMADKGTHAFFCTLLTGSTTVVSDTVEVNGVVLYTPEIISFLGTDTLVAVNDTLFVPYPQDATAHIMSQSTNGTVYYTTDTTASAEYDGGDSWTKSDADTFDISVTPTLDGVYLTVATVLEASDNVAGDTVYASAFYIWYYPTVTLNRDNALSSLAIADTDGEPLGVTVLYTYETTTTNDDGTTSTTTTTIDLTNSSTLKYTSDDESVATVDGDGIVTAHAVGIVVITAQLTALKGYYALSSSDTINVTINVTENYMPEIYIEESTTISYQQLSDDDYTDEDVYEFAADGTVYVGFSVPEGDDFTSYKVFYTLDGSTPTWQNAHTYEGSPIEITHTCYIHAIAYKVGESASDEQTVSVGSQSGYSNPTSIARASIHFPSTKGVFLGDDEDYSDGQQLFITSQTCDNAAYEADYSEDEEPDTLCIITLGSEGDDDNLWDDTGAAGQIKSSRIYRYINYSVGQTDAKNEPATFLNTLERGSYHGNAANDATAYNTFNIPISGCYVKIEPKQDGEMSVGIRQNGIVSSSDYDESNREDDYENMRRRMVYVCDETGQPIDSLRAMINTNSTIVMQSSENDDGDTQTINIYEKCSAESPNMTFYQKLVYSKYMTLQGYNYYGVDDEWPADSLAAAATFWKESASSKMPYNLTYKDGKGWLTMSLAYVLYTFPVDAGRTYFIMGDTTKISPCGFEFTPAASTAASTTTVTIDGTSTDNVSALAAANKGACTVTLTRTFNANIWTSLVLPISVSPSMVEDVFGEGTAIMHFNGTSGEALNLMKHYHQMIVAGTPIFIKPTKAVTNPTFTNVTYGTYSYTVDDNDTWTINEVGDYTAADNSVTSEDWTLKCSYTPETTSSNYYKMAYKITESSDTTNTFYHYSTATTMAGTRAWLQTESSTARLTSIVIGDISGIDELDDSESTGILNAIMGNDTPEGCISNGTGDIYSINGQLVRHASDGIDGLAKGVYIINGMKFVIK